MWMTASVHGCFTNPIPPPPCAFLQPVAAVSAVSGNPAQGLAFVPPRTAQPARPKRQAANTSTDTAALLPMFLLTRPAPCHWRQRASDARDSALLSRLAAAVCQSLLPMTLVEPWGLEGLTRAARLVSLEWRTAAQGSGPAPSIANCHNIHQRLEDCPVGHDGLCMPAWEFPNSRFPLAQLLTHPCWQKGIWTAIKRLPTA